MRSASAGSFPVPGELLPHRPPMLLIQRVISHSTGETVCEGEFDATFAQFCGGEIPSAFGLELIAQAAAVHAALAQRASGETHQRATRGLLLGSRRLELSVVNLPTDEPLKVSVLGGNEAAGPGGLIRFEGSVCAMDGTMLVRGDVTVLEWRPDAVQLA